MSQYTIRHPVSYSGFGIYYKRVSSIHLLPAPPDTGILFEKRGYIRTSVENAYLHRHTIGLKNGEETILSVEHLLAAIYGMGIDNLIVKVEGDEVPFGDGSGEVFWNLLKKAGTKPQEGRKSFITLRSPIFIREPGSFLYISPFPSLFVSYLFSYNSKKGILFLNVNRQRLEKIIRARTFGYYSDPDWLCSTFGIELERDGKFLFAKEERFKNEFLYHKVLDLIGTLALLGKPLKAAIFAYKTGHNLGLKFLREMKRRGYERTNPL